MVGSYLAPVAETYLKDPMFSNYPPFSVGVAGRSKVSSKGDRVVVPSLKRGAPCIGIYLLCEKYRFDGVVWAGVGRWPNRI